MSAVGRSGEGRRWKIRQQVAALCMQGWMNERYEPALEEWEVWLTQQDEERRKAEMLKQHEIWWQSFLTVPMEEGAC